MKNIIDDFYTDGNFLYYIKETNIFKINLPTQLSLIPFAKNSRMLPLIEWKIPKPSATLLIDFLFKAAGAYNMHRSEIESFIVWLPEENRYDICVPPQDVSATRCEFEFHDRPDNSIIVLDCHSHHTMPITFSQVDDACDFMLEIIPHISLVVKNINHINFLDLSKNVDIRLFFMGNHYNFNVYDIFEFERQDLSNVKPIRQVAITSSHDVYMPETMRNNFDNGERIENIETKNN